MTWNYKRIFYEKSKMKSVMSEFDIMGKDGWELISDYPINNYHFSATFKKQIMNEVNNNDLE